MTKKKKSTKGKGTHKRRRYHRHKGALNGLVPANHLGAGDTAVQTAMHLGCLVGGMVAGVAAKQYSFWAGLPLAVWSIYVRQPHLLTVASAMMLTPNIVNTINSASNSSSSPQIASPGAVNGIDVKGFFEDVKDRTKSYLQNIGDKVMLKEPQTGTSNALFGDEPVTYFVNPFGSQAVGELPDMSALDAVQAQIAQMSAAGRATPADQSRVPVNGLAGTNSFGFEAFDRNF